jgi:ABC-2 type transport system ATP-binding protein
VLLLLFFFYAFLFQGLAGLLARNFAGGLIGHEEDPFRLGGSYYPLPPRDQGGLTKGQHPCDRTACARPVCAHLLQGLNVGRRHSCHQTPTVCNTLLVANLSGTDETRTEVIRTEALTKSYPGTDFKAVDALDLTVYGGEIFGLLGPNGAGKTTTAGMLTTRVIPTSGRALIGGVDVVRQPALAKQLIGTVSQQNTLDRQLNCWENLYFHGLLFGMGSRQSSRQATELLDKFQLGKWGTASVYALSGGMAQRLMVARSIMHRPAVLFLDEPTAGLDPQGRLSLWQVLTELNRQGQTILLTTHYMEEADRLCDRLAIMDHGRILALDSPERLKATVGADTVVTVKVSGDPASLAPVLSSLVAGVTSTRVVGGAVEMQVNRTDRLVPRVVSAVEEAGYDLADLSVAPPTLETVFINLTGKDLRE